MTTPAIPTVEDREQFTAEFWSKVPRKVYRGKIAKLKHHTETNQVEIFIEGAPSFRHDKADIKQLLTPKLNVEVEVVNNEFVTGLFVVDVKGWAFRMTDQDIADHARKVATLVQERQQQVRREVMDRLSQLIETTLDDLDFGDHLLRHNTSRALGTVVLRFIEETL